ncbi:DUF6628 family protein [Sphingomonas nostoxanthinifaciens]|uniref:DUF6628 family protein n=1 Tax=Sphingomonas nostoxanthinifaciens TaxID=2872652 RepID=UPI001CC20973|nr:DUF6628 family protein [Sphingomonas nostoxanthinifaciens]UAK26186.1 hypothetical protein K8P63_08845 [Sphingomonas nostoxanthinifaciens]
MTERTIPTEALLPHAVPADPYARLLLFGIRRMAAGGIADAHAAHAFFTGFGLGYRRPLVLLRALMAEMSRVATTKVAVAPCCCPRMTRAERHLLDAIVQAGPAPAIAHATLTGLLKVHDCLGLVTSAQAVSISFADAGMTIKA